MAGADIVFTDGACTQNGRAGARASYAATGAVSVSGVVAPFEYAPELGFAPGTTPAAPSNNRGELLGITHALLGLLRLSMAGMAAAAPLTTCEIISDSRISIMTLLEWLPARRAAGTAHKLRNLDLLTIAEALLAALRALRPVALTHVHSHRRAPPADAPARDHLIWAGNAAADTAATSALL
jgi:ribonuclease HI